MTITSVKINDHIFIMPPETIIYSFSAKNISALDSNMQCHHAASEVVVIHMTKAIIFHKAFEFLLPWMHADGLRQVTITCIISSNQLAQPG